jgi:hypothetical protein
MLPVVIVLVYALAVARVTRLITEDVLTERPREAIQDWAWRCRYGRLAPDARADRAPAPKIAYLVSCPWCASIYVAALAAPVAYFWGESPWLFVPALALAFSHVTGLLAKNGE